jgi:predicted DCC family thiol-disulfide oxidoreductase YuxK
MPPRDKVTLVYDQECPVCRYYASRVELSQCELELVDARKPGKLMDEISAAGIDIDEGMAVRTSETLLLGSDAIRELASRSSRRGLVNRFTAWLFRSPRVAGVLYPPLVGGRRLLLKILGKTRINNLGRSGKLRF